MLERLVALLEEKAAANAVHEGVPVAVSHLHGACSEVQMLLRQARDAVFARHSGGMGSAAVVEPAQRPVPPLPSAPVPVQPALK
jgi:hypothetical protein